MRPGRRNRIYFIWSVILHYLTQAEVNVYLSELVRAKTAADSWDSDHRHGGLCNKHIPFTSVPHCPSAAHAHNSAAMNNHMRSHRQQLSGLYGLRYTFHSVVTLLILYKAYRRSGIDSRRQYIAHNSNSAILERSIAWVMCTMSSLHCVHKMNA
jgi:hypothetical protein